MRETLTTMATAVLACVISVVPLHAQAPVLPEWADASCEYCGDFTDAGVGAGVVKTAYRAGIGYADDGPIGPAAATCADAARASCERVADIGK